MKETSQEMTYNKLGIITLTLISFSVLPVISNAGNVPAIRAEAHRANPTVICPSSKNG